MLTIWGSQGKGAPGKASGLGTSEKEAALVLVLESCPIGLSVGMWVPPLGKNRLSWAGGNRWGAQGWRIGEMRQAWHEL